jgi:hypothetical protein
MEVLLSESKNFDMIYKKYDSDIYQSIVFISSDIYEVMNMTGWYKGLQDTWRSDMKDEDYERIASEM